MKISNSVNLLKKNILETEQKFLACKFKWDIVDKVQTLYSL